MCWTFISQLIGVLSGEKDKFSVRRRGGQGTVVSMLALHNPSVAGLILRASSLSDETINQGPVSMLLVGC